jgi:hypothetical protein
VDADAIGAQDSNDEEFDPNPYYYHREVGPAPQENGETEFPRSDNACALQMQSGQMPPGMGGGSMTGAVGMSPAFGGSGGMGGVGSFNLNANAVNAFGANAGGNRSSLYLAWRGHTPANPCPPVVGTQPVLRQGCCGPAHAEQHYSEAK